MPWSPSFDYLQEVWLQTLRSLGFDGAASLDAWGFYPIGEGRIVLQLGGVPAPAPGLAPLTAVERGALRAIEGRAVAASLPSHIAQRMADRAEALLRPLGVPARVATARVSAASPGAWIFLRASYDMAVAGFGALGRRGKPAEEVAADAVSELLDHHRCGAAFDRHLADQMLLPLAIAAEPSEFSFAAVTRHLETNAWVIEQFDVARIEITRDPDGTGHVRVVPNCPPTPG